VDSAETAPFGRGSAPAYGYSRIPLFSRDTARVVTLDIANGFRT